MKDWNTSALDAYEIQAEQAQHRMDWARGQAKEYFRDNPQEFIRMFDSDDVVKVLFDVAGEADGLCMAFAYRELPDVITEVIEEKAQEYFEDSL